MDNSQVSFKERVCQCAIESAFLFKKNFIDYEYGIFSEAFGKDNYFKIQALDGNYLHLVGVNTSMPADTFFKKCLNATLKENDFDFCKKGVTGNSIKGTVRDKIRVLSCIVKMFEPDKLLYVQKDFKKNKIECAFVSTDNICTLGFSDSGHPKTLLRGDHLDNTKTYPVDLILKREVNNEKFNEILYCENKIDGYNRKVKEVATKELIEQLYTTTDDSSDK